MINISLLVLFLVASILVSAVYLTLHASERNVVRLGNRNRYVTFVRRSDGLYELRKTNRKVQQEYLVAPLEEHIQPPQMQPVINVNIDTGAISQALLLGMKVLVEEQTHTLSDVLREAFESRETTVQELSRDRPVAVQEMSREERVKQYLFTRPDASVREIERETGIPKTAVATIKTSLKGGRS